MYYTDDNTVVCQRSRLELGRSGATAYCVGIVNFFWWTQQTVFIACINTPRAATVSSDRCNEFTTFMTSDTFLTFIIADAASVAMFKGRFWKDFSNEPHFSDQRTGTPIIVFGAWLDVGSSLELMTPVLEISRDLDSVAMKTVAGIVAHFTSSDCHGRREGSKHWCQFVSLQYLRCKFGPAFLHFVKVPAGNHENKNNKNKNK